MKNSQKLKLIKKISRKTQEELSRDLEVSFATFNSWINGKSEPRSKNIKKIDNLYSKYTGQKSIPDSVLRAKKDLIIGKSKKYKNLIEHILKRKDIYDEFLLQLTYNTNRIEGSTLTVQETASILFNNATIRNKDLVEHLEAKNHQTAFDFLMQQISKKFVVSEGFILKLHSILMHGIRKDAGVYRNHAVRIVGSNVPTANYQKIQKLMSNLVTDMNQSSNDVIEKVSIIHSNFEQIHPFSDGNGRIGRLIIQVMLLKNNIAPSIIREQDRQIYYTYLQKSQLDNERAMLEDFVAEGVLLGFDILDNLGT